MTEMSADDVARQHRQQHRFADAGAGEDAHALAAADGEEGIERAHAEIERRADPHAGMRRRRRSAERIRRRPRRQRPLPVDRLAHGVDHAAEPALRRPYGAGGGGDHRAAAAPHAVERGKRHGQRMAAVKARPPRRGSAARCRSRSTAARRPTWRGSAPPPPPSARARRPRGHRSPRCRGRRSVRPGLSIGHVLRRQARRAPGRNVRIARRSALSSARHGEKARRIHPPLGLPAYRDFNGVFTRVVNHWVIVHGTDGHVSPGQDERGESVELVRPDS